MPETENLHGANLIDVAYGEDSPALDDASECYFEASKLHLRALSWDVPGGVALDQSEELRLLSQRAARTNPSRESIPLPEPGPPVADFATVLQERRSAEDFAEDPLSWDLLAGMLDRSFRVRLANGWPRRPVPSGGALYPLDLYVVAQNVGELKRGLYHYDPFRHALTWMRPVDHDALQMATLQPNMAAKAAAMIIVGGSFWRSRFKYGHRALRFCLLEAGHVGQNLLLLAQAFGISARPIGGFLDDDFAANMDYDGVNEAPLYVVLLGARTDDATASSQVL